MARILNKDQFRSITVELPIELVDGIKGRAKAEKKSLTQKMRELIEEELSNK